MAMYSSPAVSPGTFSDGSLQSGDSISLRTMPLRK
jgi:hypothetical protein